MRLETGRIILTLFMLTRKEILARTELPGTWGISSMWEMKVMHLQFLSSPELFWKSCNYAVKQASNVTVLFFLVFWINMFLNNTALKWFYSYVYLKLLLNLWSYDLWNFYRLNLHKGTGVKHNWHFDILLLVESIK